MTRTPLSPDTDVLAVTVVESDDGAGRIAVAPWVTRAWPLPLDDATVEELARIGHDRYFVESWEQTSQMDRALWVEVIRAVFARLQEMSQ